MANYDIKQKNVGQKCKTWGCCNNAKIKGYCNNCYNSNRRQSFNQKCTLVSEKFKKIDNGIIFTRQSKLDEYV